jgi:hypothetical protein
VKNGGNMQFLNIVWHDIVRNMYEKEEYNKTKIGKTCQKSSIFRISRFSLQNGYKLMQN